LRFIYKILIGMMLFSAFMFFFTNTMELGVPQGTDIETSDPGYRITTESLVTDFLSGFLSILSLGALATIATRNPIFIGVSMFVGLIIGLWNAGFNNITTMFSEYEYMTFFFTVFNIMMGILAVIAITDIFSGRATDD
jgi:hypothetical protein